ncbi:MULTISPECIES: hypothetical protein [Burkholderia]|uniref:hypothetical protein n=1 Tax=Burkholderia TaxID=32008 RepID=UPI0010518699|nr:MULTISPECIES: hypothetical protein [Burkholderia]
MMFIRLLIECRHPVTFSQMPAEFKIRKVDRTVQITRVSSHDVRPRESPDDARNLILAHAEPLREHALPRPSGKQASNLDHRSRRQLRVSASLSRVTRTLSAALPSSTLLFAIADVVFLRANRKVKRIDASRCIANDVSDNQIVDV